MYIEKRWFLFFEYYATNDNCTNNTQMVLIIAAKSTT